MAQINLLPWREELRQEKKKEFLVQLVGACVFALIACFLWVQSVEGSVSNQLQRNQILEGEIAVLQKQVVEIKDLKKRRKELLDRMKVIQDLEGKRSVIVHYFDEFAKSMPDGVFFTSLKRNGDSFSIEGISESNQRISALMRNLDQSLWFSNPNLKSVDADPKLGEQAGKFVMQLSAVVPEANKLEEGAKNGSE